MTIDVFICSQCPQRQWAPWSWVCFSYIVLFQQNYIDVWWPFVNSTTEKIKLFKILIMCFSAAWSKHLAPSTHRPRVWLQSPLCQRREARSAMESSQMKFSSSCTLKLELQVGNKKQVPTVGWVIAPKFWNSHFTDFTSLNSQCLCF